jgi:hypothetical protein
MTATATTTAQPKSPKQDKSPGMRKHLRKLGRAKRRAKLLGDKEYAKTFFAARSKRSTDKKSTFRKKKSKKK